MAILKVYGKETLSKLVVNLHDAVTGKTPFETDEGILSRYEGIHLSGVSDWRGYEDNLVTNVARLVFHDLVGKLPGSRSDYNLSSGSYFSLTAHVRFERLEGESDDDANQRIQEIIANPVVQISYHESNARHPLKELVVFSDKFSKEDIRAAYSDALDNYTGVVKRQHELKKPAE